MAEAKIAFVDGDLAGAEKLLRGLAGNDARTLRGRVLLERGRCDEALRVFGEVLNEAPQKFEALRGSAVASRRLGRLDLAILYWTRATELRKEDSVAWRELALCQRESDDALGARLSLQQALSLDPQQSDLPRLLTELTPEKRDPALRINGAIRVVNFDPVHTTPLDPTRLFPRAVDSERVQDFPRLPVRAP